MSTLDKIRWNRFKESITPELTKDPGYFSIPGHIEIDDEGTCYVSRPNGLDIVCLREGNA